MKGIALAFVVCLLGASACRSKNPAYRDSATVPASQGSQAGTSSAPAHSASKSTSEGSQAGASGRPTQEQTTKGAAPTSSSSASSSSASSSSETQPPSARVLCSGREYLCYPMISGGDDSTYPPVQDDEPALGPMFETKLHHAQDPLSLVFGEHLTIRDGARLKSEGSIETSPQRDYGFEVSIRNASCDGPKVCVFAVVGNISLSLDLTSPTQAVFCRGYDEKGEMVGEVSTLLDPAQENHVGCYAKDKSLFLFVQGMSFQSSMKAAIDRQSEIALRLGALNVGTQDGHFVGDIGRLRYWRDPEMMREELLAK